MNDDLQEHPTEIRRALLYEDRWASEGGRTGIISLADRPTARALAAMDLFNGIDPPLLEDITQDVSIASWEAGAVLFEEGSYIDLAFFIVEGEVVIHTSQAQNEARLGTPIFDQALVQVSDQAQRPNPAVSTVLESMIVSQTATRAPQPGQAPFLSTIDVDLPDGKAMLLGPGEIFGEIGALNGWPQAVTARAKTRCKLVQIRVPALRRLKDDSPAFKKRIDDVYRERTLLFHLRKLPLLSSCDDRTIQSLAEKVDLVSVRPGKTLVKEGDPADGIYLVRSGCLRLSQKMADGEIAVAYLSKGMVLGDVELLLVQGHSWFSTVTSVGYSELVKMDSDVVSSLLAHSEIEKHFWRSAVDRVKETGYSQRHVDYAELLDFSLNRGLVEGNSILVIDLDRCTRCDDCVRACAETHGGRPRFVREGERYRSHLIARACYHCRDPVCLIGCPTGAIHRAQVGDVVEIQEDICIGCSQCSKKCPYDAIIMQPTGDVWPEDAVPKHLRGKPRSVASKCDLCHTSSTGPACVNSCPQGCAIRVGTMDDFKSMLRPGVEVSP